MAKKAKGPAKAKTRKPAKGAAKPADAAAVPGAANDHRQRLAVAGAALKTVEDKLGALVAKLKAALAHASATADHLPHLEAFLRDVGLKADEITAWIGRTLPGK